MFDVVALGEMLIDFAPVETDPAGYPTLKAQPGGAPCNFLAALQKYGCSTAIIGKVGADSFGNLLVQTAADCGIETRGVRKDASSFTTLAFVTLDATGNREFSFARKPGADTQLTAEEVDYDLIENCRELSCIPLRNAQPDRQTGADSDPESSCLRKRTRKAYQL